MKRLTTLALIAGLCTVIGLFLSSGLTDVAAAVISVGWAVLAVVAVRAAAVGWAGLGWFAVFPSRQRPSLWSCVSLRFVREGINTLLPVAQVGGDFVGGRLLAKRGVPAALAGASMFVDLMTQALTQFLFTMGGLALLVWIEGDGPIVRAVAGGLAVAAPALFAFYLLQRRGGHRLIEAALRRFAGAREWRIFGAVDQLYDSLRRLYRNGPRVTGAIVIHLIGWVVGALEVWICLRAMGFSIGFTEALVIESLAQAVRGAAFAIPGALGAQEGGLVALCAIFGIPMEAALALSLVKRAADLSIGIPGLIGWHALEGRRAPEPAAATEGLKAVHEQLGRAFEARPAAYGFASPSRPVDVERGDLKKCA